MHSDERVINGLIIVTTVSIDQIHYCEYSFPFRTVVHAFAGTTVRRHAVSPA